MSNKVHFKNNKQIIGRWGERLAENYLSQKGYTILERNFRTPYGEIDLIAQKVNIITFVEVKTRTARQFGFPEEAVTSAKQIHLENSANFYINQHPEVQCSWQIDVISISGTVNQSSVEIEHFENITS